MSSSSGGGIRTSAPNFGPRGDSGSAERHSTALNFHKGALTGGGGSQYTLEIDHDLAAHVAAALQFDRGADLFDREGLMRLVPGADVWQPDEQRAPRCRGQRWRRSPA
jgi:hypothetical protein